MNQLEQGKTGYEFLITAGNMSIDQFGNIKISKMDSYEISEIHEVVIQQDQNFNFRITKNRYGNANIIISPNKVQQLLDSNLKVKLISNSGLILADNSLNQRPKTQDEMVDI